MLSRLFPVLVSIGVAIAQQGPVTCRNCMNHGTLPCPKHGRELALEQPAHGTLFCSVAAACKACQGALAIDCQRCVNPAAERALAERQRLVAAWLAARRQAVDALVDNRPLLHLETPHCELVFSIRPLMVGRVRYDTHPLMHLYGERIEALHALFRERLDLADADLPGKLRVFLFRDQQDHEIVGPRLTGVSTSNSTGVKLMGVDCIYSMWQDPRMLADDEQLHRAVVHHVTHLLVSNLVESNWLGNMQLGWLDAGLAHWFEDAVTGKCANFCFEEVLLQPGAGFKGGAWRTPVRVMVDEGSAVPFAELATRNTDQLTFPEHALSFAYVDFLLQAHGGAKLRDLLRLVKRRVAIRDALQQVYLLNPLTIETAFKTWVVANYSPRPQR
jgi:hypothetical protein